MTSLTDQAESGGALQLSNGPSLSQAGVMYLTGHFTPQCPRKHPEAGNFSSDLSFVFIITVRPGQGGGFGHIAPRSRHASPNCGGLLCFPSLFCTVSKNFPSSTRQVSSFMSKERFWRKTGLYLGETLFGVVVLQLHLLVRL